ncbi:MAG: hypothetical protein HQK84_02180 [Nitrospinae bacterium]|nr:hypothetical protein [Nitrospinota bacterium]
MNEQGFTGYVRNLLLRLTANPISATGTILGVSVLIIFTLFMLTYMVSAEAVNPYYGALVFLGFPAFIIFSILLIFLGKLLLKDKPHEDIFWFKYFKSTDEKNIIAVVGVLIVLVVAFFSISNMQVSKFMNSTNFCGETCHLVMEPEAVAHKHSPHAKVECIQCHVGEGVEGFIMSKWRGMYQVYSLTFNKFSKPIPTPVETLPSSEDTCLECHNTARTQHKSMKVYFDYKNDEINTPLVSAITLNLGTSKAGEANGIHAHSSSDLKIKYFAEDDKRQNIQWVQATKNNTTKTWMIEGVQEPEILNIEKTSKGRPIYTIKGKGKLREMDCVDCHNRVGHDFVSAKTIVNRLIEHNKVRQTIPFVKNASQDILEKLAGMNKESFEETINREVNRKWPTLQESEKLAVQLLQAANTYLYPRMNITWDSYKSMLSHPNRGEGCFRCHNQRMKDENGVNLTQDCSTCHITVADKITLEEWEEKYDLPLK